MTRVARAAPVLTVVIDDDIDRDKKIVRFALDMMKDDEILIRPAAEMPMIAEAVRHELCSMIGRRKRGRQSTRLGE